MPKNARYCYNHKESVEQARPQAEEDSEAARELFKEEAAADPLAFRTLVLNFEYKCPALGRGKRRARFAWAEVIEEWRAETTVKNANNNNMMNYIDYAVYQTTYRRKTESEATAMWYKALDNSKVRKDRLGTDDDGNLDWRVEVIK
eukprot:15039813-Alexandrium_andersonii.AAC.1